MSLYTLLRSGLFQLAPEDAHNASILALKSGLSPFCPVPDYKSLNISVAGLNFKNPIGMAAGYDKNAEVPSSLYKMGFGSVEVGTITPLPQAGNPKPRMFRLVEDEAVINRLGFNNDGIEVVKNRILAQKDKYTGILGINIGANKNSTDRINDYVIGMKAFLTIADYITINISSPNTPGLRDLQGIQFLEHLLNSVMNEKSSINSSTPIFLKIAPDLSLEDLDDILQVCVRQTINGIIVSNTTIARDAMLKSAHAHEAGGLSGQPLFEPSTLMLKECYKRLNGQIPLIGVGGITSGATALQKILAGASLIQLYTGLIYKGPSLIHEIVNTLDSYCNSNGYTSISQAVGTNA